MIEKGLPPFVLEDQVPFKMFARLFEEGCLMPSSETTSSVIDLQKPLGAGKHKSYAFTNMCVPAPLFWEFMKVNPGVVRSDPDSPNNMEPLRQLHTRGEIDQYEVEISTMYRAPSTIVLTVQKRSAKLDAVKQERLYFYFGYGHLITLLKFLQIIAEKKA